ASHGGFARAHGIEVADGQERELGMIQAFDQLHVGKVVGIAGAVDRAAVGQSHDVAGRLAAVDDLIAIQNAAAVDGVGHGGGNRSHGGRAALIHAERVLGSLGFEPAGGFLNRHDLRRKLLGQWQDVVDVIEVAVGNQNDVQAID